MNLPEQLSLFRLPPVVAPPRRRPIQLGIRVVDYELRQGGRRRLSLHIDERGLRVGAPAGIALADIEAFIRTHADWVLEKLDEFAGSTVHRQLAIRHGQRIPVFGDDITVWVTPGANRFRWFKAHLELAARPDGDLDALARKALQHHALAHFDDRLGLFADRMGLVPPRLSLTSARTRWGSCSRQHGIRLNWRLIHLAPDLVDYVVVHELAHLREMNHSPRFWAEVAAILPDWQARRAALKQAGREIPLI